MARQAGLEALTSTVVTMSDLLVRESVTLGPRPLATSVILRPSAGLHTPTWMDRQTDRQKTGAESFLSLHQQGHLFLMVTATAIVVVTVCV